MSGYRAVKSDAAGLYEVEGPLVVRKHTLGSKVAAELIAEWANRALPRCVDLHPEPASLGVSADPAEGGKP